MRQKGEKSQDLNVAMCSHLSIHFPHAQTSMDMPKSGMGAKYIHGSVFSFAEFDDFRGTFRPLGLGFDPFLHFDQLYYFSKKLFS